MDPALVDLVQLHRHLGAVPNDDGVQFSVWSPRARRVDVRLRDGRTMPLEKLASGFHVATDSATRPGDRYSISVDGRDPRPDPASRFQPDGVHGFSQVVDSNFSWQNDTFDPGDIRDAVIMEAHLGCLSPRRDDRKHASGASSGSSLNADPVDWDAVSAWLDRWSDLGVTAIEWLPLAQSAGRWNWGYDGVHLFAPHCDLGPPDTIRRLVDLCHSKGIAAYLDVVYNHLGPEGNYLADIGPYLSKKHQTVWGPGPNFDHARWGQAVTRFFIANAIYWLDEFRFDGLRVDAIHCIRDDSQPHFAAKLAQATRQYEATAKRTVHLIAESNVYDPEMTLPNDQGGIGFDAQWGDDFLHSLHAAIRPGQSHCQREYFSGTDFAETLKTGYVYSGTVRGDRGRATPPPNQPHAPESAQSMPQSVAPVSTERLMWCIQNHDFVGNHPEGKRIDAFLEPAEHAAAAALLMLSPAIPMLFMGQECGLKNPFQFFVDFGDERLRRAVVRGRKREYPQHDWQGAPLPTDANAYFESKLPNIKDIDSPSGANSSLFDRIYRELIALRTRFRSSGLLRREHMHSDVDPQRDRYAFSLIRGSECLHVEAQFHLQGGSPKNPSAAASNDRDILWSSEAIFPAGPARATVRYTPPNSA
ncbi:MAG: alpha-amylase family glycosyl hydrolase [Planctomycetota bacterium]